MVIGHPSTVQSRNIDSWIFTEVAMDVAGNRVEAGHVRDEVAERTQKRFQDFLEEWRDEGDDGPKYLKVIKFTEVTLLLCLTYSYKGRKRPGGP